MVTDGLAADARAPPLARVEPPATEVGRGAVGPPAPSDYPMSPPSL